MSFLDLGSGRFQFYLILYKASINFYTFIESFLLCLYHFEMLYRLLFCCTFAHMKMIILPLICWSGVDSVLIFVILQQMAGLSSMTGIPNLHSSLPTFGQNIHAGAFQPKVCRSIQYRHICCQFLYEYLADNSHTRYGQITCNFCRITVLNYI